MGTMNNDLKMSKPALGGIKNNVFTAIADKTATKQKNVEPSGDGPRHGWMASFKSFTKKANTKTSPEYLKQINKKRTNTILGD